MYIRISRETNLPQRAEGNFESKHKEEAPTDGNCDTLIQLLPALRLWGIAPADELAA